MIEERKKKKTKKQKSEKTVEVDNLETTLKDAIVAFNFFSYPTLFLATESEINGKYQNQPNPLILTVQNHIEAHAEKVHLSLPQTPLLSFLRTGHLLSTPIVFKSSEFSHQLHSLFPLVPSLSLGFLPKIHGDPNDQTAPTLIYPYNIF